MIQNEAERTSNPKALDAGDSPANSPPRPKRKYAKLAISEAMPRALNAKRHVDQLKNNSATKGPAKKARVGRQLMDGNGFPPMRPLDQRCDRCDRRGNVKAACEPQAEESCAHRP